MVSVNVDLSGRTAVITGAAGGLGRVFADRLSAAGAKLVLWDLDTSSLPSPSGSNEAAPLMIDVDITDEAAVAKAFDETLSRVGEVDILINNAGILGAQGPLESFDIETWRKVFDVNVTGTVIVSKKFMTHMRARNHGRIVNISSIAGKEGLPGSGAYGASKAAIIWLTKLKSRDSDSAKEDASDSGTKEASSAPNGYMELEEFLGHVRTSVRKAAQAKAQQGRG